MKDSLVIRLLERIELFLYRKAASVVSVTRSFKQNLIGRGIDEGKIHVITNGVDLDRFQPRKKDANLVDRYGLAGKFVAGYIGTHGMAHALETILDAAKDIKNLSGGDDFRFILLGNGAG
jgi:glycosyltransferase involved in cell wall biosynthesis